MKAVGRPKTATGLVLIAAAMAVVGCSESPKEKYQDALEQVKEAKSDRAEVKETLDQKKEALAEARGDVKEARQNYQQAQQKVDQASKKVDEVVSDALLFRTIQRKLVAKDQFDDSAISVSVNNRVVTLSGTVPNDDVRQQALKMARNKPGVKKVVNSLHVSQPSDQQNSDQQKDANKGSSGGNNSSNAKSDSGST